MSEQTAPAGEYPYIEWAANPCSRCGHEGHGKGRCERVSPDGASCTWCGGPKPRRVLVTGSRDWTNVDLIVDALADAWRDLGQRRDTILVQGECHLGGADLIAKEIWQAWGLPVESHPAERGPDGHVLGPKRNAHMVSLGADLCLAFPLPSSRGTRNCMRLAREAGIEVRVINPLPLVRSGAGAGEHGE